MTNSILKNRILKAKKELKKISQNACLFLCSGTEIIKSRDLTHDFKQDKNFYYFTNSQIKNCSILIFGDDSKETLVLAPYQSKEEILWLGENESASKLAKEIDAEFIDIEYVKESFVPFLRGIDTLCFNSYEYSISNNVAKMLLKENTAMLEKQRLPYQFINQDFVISKLRQVKEKDEIECTRKAIRITLEAIEELKNFLHAGITELDAKNFLDYEFKKRGGDIAFETICAGGKNAATLHHTSTNKILKNGEMLLIDCGAEYGMYSADISRTIPVSGKYTLEQEVLIEAVKTAQKEAIKTAVAGVKYGEVQLSAEKALIDALVKLKVLTGKQSKIIENNEIREYFPHSIGHLLGLDTHDIGRLFLNDTLKKNMILTIEPGLYFSKKVAGILPFGIRIEDDILIKEKASEVLR